MAKPALCGEKCFQFFVYWVTRCDTSRLTFHFVALPHSEAQTARATPCLTSPSAVDEPRSATTGAAARLPCLQHTTAEPQRPGTSRGGAGRYKKSARPAAGRLVHSPPASTNMKVYVLLSALLACVAAEAPLGRQYLAPSAQYGPPGAGGGGVLYAAPRPSAPGSSYGAPGPRPFSAKVAAPRPFSVGGGPSTSYGLPRPGGMAPAPVYGVPTGGRPGAREDPYYEPANYEFSYTVQDAASYNDFSHQETRKDENAQGEYRVLLPDGRVQVVSYRADEDGYHPTIQYEQTGRAAPAPAPGFGSDGYRY
ncbi:pro-resilin-like [Schistocerca piceifrons]|uniref:pro-resilin-like n=1 Tax=Schistocerca piceifrons TaxID=274613 RepID=UPI001F5FAEF3|nr:pro-resilin-like [Schistocerca piceifrons]